jgi:hypothetical protein
MRGRLANEFSEIGDGERVRRFRAGKTAVK